MCRVYKPGMPEMVKMLFYDSKVAQLKGGEENLMNPLRSVVTNVSNVPYEICLLSALQAVRITWVLYRCLLSCREKGNCYLFWYTRKGKNNWTGWVRKENSSNFKTYAGAHNLQLKIHIPVRKGWTHLPRHGSLQFGLPWWREEMGTCREGSTTLASPQRHQPFRSRRATCVADSRSATVQRREGLALGLHFALLHCTGIVFSPGAFLTSTEWKCTHLSCK